MQYKTQTIRSYRTRMKNQIAKYMQSDAENLHVCISRGNNKIGRVLNVSLPPIMACGNCKECCKYCYDIKACMRYSDTMKARARNWTILKKNREKYFAEIRSRLASKKTNKFFRWHVAGDIVDADYFDHMVKIAKDFPDFQFWTYTKMYFIVNQYVASHGGRRSSIPANLSIMFSRWEGMPMENPYHFAEFRCILEGEPEPENVNICPGNCDVCKSQGLNCVLGHNNVYCHEH